MTVAAVSVMGVGAINGGVAAAVAAALGLLLKLVGVRRTLPRRTGTGVVEEDTASVLGVLLVLAPSGTALVLARRIAGEGVTLLVDCS